MDIERKDLAVAKRRRHIIHGVIGFVVIALVTVGVSQLKPAAPGVETSTLYMGTVLGLLDSPTEGNYWLSSTSVANATASERERERIRNREVGLLFQSFNLP